MTDPSPTLILAGLSRLDQASLLQRLPSGSAEVREVGLAPGELGEPATVILTIALSVMTLTAICGWLSLKGKDVELTLQAQAPGGIGGTVSVKISGRDTPAEAQAKFADAGISVPS
jgi:hypothetical protein